MSILGVVQVCYHTYFTRSCERFIVRIYQSGLFFLSGGPTMKECNKKNKEQNNTIPHKSKFLVIYQTQNL
jgi:hypothetical protein